MAMRYDECEKLYSETLGSLTNSKENYTNFLTTLGNNYKYDFEDQLLIYAQSPKATACASFEFWIKHGQTVWEIIKDLKLKYLLII